MASVLVVDGDDEARGDVLRLLQTHHYETMEAFDGVSALELIDAHDPDLVLTALHLRGKTGLELLETLRERTDTRPVLVMAESDDIELGLKATRLGAVDFVERPLKIARLLMSLENAQRFAQLFRENTQLRMDAAAPPELLGKSALMAHVHEEIRKLAASEERVLILGEGGTGKELAAAAIHDASPRRTRPFVKVSCAGLSPEQIEAELFGHEQGAFNGTHAARRGKLELARGGTLFLDEVEAMLATTQAKLLRVLSEGTFERLGSSRTLSADVRVVVSANHDLAALVQKKEFREDLHQSLSGAVLRLPALRERRGDVGLLAQRLLGRALERNGRSGLTLDDDALEELSKFDFPGNVRELANLIERLALLADGPVIGRSDVLRLVPEPRGGSGVRRAVSATPAARFVPGVTYRELIARAEREVLIEAIAAFKGNKSAAARALGLERAHFAKKCRALGLRELEAAELESKAATTGRRS
jgi:DNA-binding NtrC family response regulator